MEIVNGILRIVGSLGLFLYGMKVMSDGLQKTAGERLQSVLNFVTGNRVKAILTGFVITAIIQSSSATTVMVVSLANAGLLSLAQSFGVIMGANIGTTVTGWIVAILGFKVSIEALAIPAVGIGFAMLLVKKFKQREIGEVLLGLGLLFLGLEYLKDSVPDIEGNIEVLEFLSSFARHGILSRLLFVFVGLVITVIVQSSSAAMAITLTMAYTGWIDYPTAAAMVLGENIGTTITAYLAAIGANVNARRASRAHILFNIAGVLWAFFLFDPFIRLVELIMPGTGAVQSVNLPAHLAMFHTAFNLINTIILSFFIPQICSLLERFVKPKKGEMPKFYSLKYHASSIQDTPELNVMEAKREVIRMARIVEQMFDQFEGLFFNPDKKMGDIVDSLKEMEDFTDQMEEELSKFLPECLRESISEKTRKQVSAMIRIVNELESIGDSIYNLVLLTQRRYDKKLEFSDDAVESFRPYCAAVKAFLVFIRSHLIQSLSEAEMEQALALEDSVNDFRNTLKKATQRRIQEGGNVKGELLFFDMIRQMEKAGDYALNVAQALRGIS
jgi:phosphate:Na+ symporter